MRLPPEEFDNLPYGLIELDAAGTILSFNNAEEERSRCRAEDVIGRNFFKDIAPCARVKDYEGRFKEFLKSPKPDEEFSFPYTFAHGKVNVHIVFVKMLNDCVLIVSKERAA